MQAWLSSGSHRYYTEGDVVFWRMVDVMDEVHLKQLLAAVDGVLLAFRRLVLLVDCAQARSLTPEARRCYGDWLKNCPQPDRASIFFSASGEMRTFLLLAQRSGQLLSGQRSAIEIVEDEAAARQRAAVLRAQWSAGRQELKG
jgi:hypothetical protein